MWPYRAIMTATARTMLRFTAAASGTSIDQLPDSRSRISDLAAISRCRQDIFLLRTRLDPSTTKGCPGLTRFRAAFPFQSDDKCVLAALDTGPVALLELLAGAAVARVVRFHLRRVANVGSVPRGLGSRCVGRGHSTRERHSGCLLARTLHFEAFETLAFLLLVARDDLEV